MQKIKIFLIRHGETTGDIEDRFGGDYDDHLTDKGIRQARELSRFLESKSIEIVFHSPRLRAKETAKIVGENLKIPLRVVNDLRERNAYGVLTGLKKSEAKARYPDEVEKLKDKIHHNVTYSEDYGLLKTRVMKAFDNIANNEFSIVAVISHGGVIGCFIREIGAGEIKLEDCAVIEIEKVDAYKVLNMKGVLIE